METQALPSGRKEMEEKDTRPRGQGEYHIEVSPAAVCRNSRTRNLHREKGGEPNPSRRHSAWGSGDTWGAGVFGRGRRGSYLRGAPKMDQRGEGGRNAADGAAGRVCVEKLAAHGTRELESVAAVDAAEEIQGVQK